MPKRATAKAVAAAEDSDVIVLSSDDEPSPLPRRSSARDAVVDEDDESDNADLREAIRRSMQSPPRPLSQPGKRRGRSAKVKGETEPECATDEEKVDDDESISDVNDSEHTSSAASTPAKDAKSRKSSNKRARDESNETGNDDDNEESKSQPKPKPRSKKQFTAVNEFSLVDITDCFRLLDRSSKGFVTCEDLMAQASALGEVFQFSELQAMIVEADARGDGNGRCSLNDFVAMCRFTQLTE